MTAKEEAKRLFDQYSDLINKNFPTVIAFYGWKGTAKELVLIDIENTEKALLNFILDHAKHLDLDKEYEWFDEVKKELKLI
jgi:hypothetical protein